MVRARSQAIALKKLNPYFVYVCRAIPYMAHFFFSCEFTRIDRMITTTTLE